MRKQLPSLWLATLYLAVAVVVVSAKYEDDYGTDWSRTGIGKVSHLVFPEGNDKRFYLTSDSNVLAAVNFIGNTSSIAWRQFLPEDIKLQLLTRKGKRLATIANNGEHLAVWRITDGALVWDKIGSSSLSKCGIDGYYKAILLNTDLNHDSVFDVLFALSGSLQMISGANGEVLWSSPIDCTTSSIVALEEPSQQLRLYTFGIESGSLVAKALSNTDGKLLQKHSFTGENSPIVSFATLGSSYIVAIDAAQYVHLLSIHSLSLGSPKWTKNTIKSLLSEQQLDISYLQIVGENQNNFLLRVSEQSTIVVTVSESVPFKPVKFINHQRNPVYAETHQGGFAVVSNEKGLLTLQTYNEFDSSINSYAIPNHEHANVDKVFFAVLGQNNIKFTALFLSDYSFSMLREGQLQWTREEGLAALSDVKIIDPPADIAEQALLEREFKLPDHASVVQQFLQQIHAQMLGFIASIPKDSASFAKWINTRIHHNEVASEFKKDDFGLRKLLLATSVNSKSIYGIDSLDGKVLWKRHFVDAVIDNLYVLRSAAHYPPEILVIMAEKGGFMAKKLNALTGDTLNSTKLSFSVKQTLPLPYSLHDEKILLFIDDNMHVHVFPDEARVVVQNHAPQTFFYRINSNSITGYGLDNHLQPIKKWHYEIPEGSTPYYGFRPPNEVIHSPIKNFATEGTVTKYINTNTIALALESISSTGHQLDILVIDTITGDVVFHTVHQGARGPIKIVISENWIVYHFFDQRLGRYQLSSVELFDKELNWDTAAFSSFSHAYPVAKPTSYHLNFDIDTCGVTVTARGITFKQIVCATKSGRIVGLDKNRFLDSRRIAKELLSPLDREEGVMGYESNLFLPLTAYHSTNRTIRGIKKVIAAPATLESTSLVLAFGTDLFLGAVLPSNSFDLLSPGFNSGMLVFGCMVLIIITTITVYFAKEKELRAQWK